MSKIDLSDCAARQRAAHSKWMENLNAKLRRDSWREMAKEYPDDFKIEAGWIWERNKTSRYPKWIASAPF